VAALKLTVFSRFPARNRDVPAADHGVCLRRGDQPLSAAGAQLFFYVFAALMGVSIAYIFVVFTAISIAQVFLITSIAFAGLSLWGYTTKKDISGWGSFLIMGVIGLIVASIVNIFLGSPAIMFAISVLGVLIFAGLTAYDTQRHQERVSRPRPSMRQRVAGKSAIMGALRLYLDFINMFMFLLQFMGAPVLRRSSTSMRRITPSSSWRRCRARCWPVSSMPRISFNAHGRWAPGARRISGTR
jgi:FtsH-binding integral membrane protein